MSRSEDAPEARGKNVTVAELTRRLDEAAHHAPEGEIVVSIHLFAIRHAPDLRTVSIPEVIAAAGARKSYVAEMHKGVKLAQSMTLKDPGRSSAIGAPP